MSTLINRQPIQANLSGINFDFKQKNLLDQIRFLEDYKILKRLDSVKN